MKKVLFVIALLALAACQPTDQGQEVSITSPFIGGTEGLNIEFQDMRAEVFDQGEDPFDVIVRVENKGEYEVPANEATVTLSGINPTEFDVDSADLQQELPDDLIGERKTAEGQIFHSSPLFVEFIGLSYVQNVPGSVQFPLRADICYDYQTTAVSKLCIREDLLKPKEGGICELTGTKPVYNSGAPVQIQNVQETVRSREKIGFSFDVVNVGLGEVYKRASDCDKEDRTNENKVEITISTGLPGLQCTGMTGNSGEITLYGGKKTVTCTQTIGDRGIDFEQLFTVELNYGYEQTIQTDFVVKSSE